MNSAVARAHHVASSIGKLERPMFISVAFNDPGLVRTQVLAFAKQCRDDSVFLLADNSPTAELSTLMRQAVRGTGALYVRLPYNLYTNSRGKAKPGRGSLSHSVALDWVWKHIVRPLSPPAVAVLDHDVFPLGPFSVSDLLQKHLVIGPLREGELRWSTWPGLTFFRYRDLPRQDLTFTPSGDLDSGGKLWDSLFRFMDKENVRFLRQQFVEVLEGDVQVKSQIEIIDDQWLHLIDGSGWFDGVGKAKELLSSPAAEKKLSPPVRKLLQQMSEEIVS